MASESEPHDSPVQWVNGHIRRYVESDGADGHEWRGNTILLLTTIGRRSGKPRRTALIYREDGGRYVVVASKGGADAPPAWYLNLAENPEVRVQVGADKFPARARTAAAEEKPALWELMAEKWPDYNNYQAKTDREIPVIVLERS
ncbi:nitroreductase family deazaflavin-dependent oxidoreductase [Wenjunlia tyrosinilytica]|uniref:Nitroreductase n=1 Tax=Wenjunlia tyrosinilytica TaxID=1544741 RepID=A0A917ZMG8_9ACTN|nr:nitroreductase family deazaflavin-dependent oxidoreductase [Wenjunlia tyrosinilytica]GGO86534.1 nitroreductase [Wenjunlia tyrosinilytica]